MAKGNTFSIVGEIKKIKDTPNFHPYEEKSYDSGWASKSLKVLVHSGNSNLFSEVTCLYKSDFSNNVFTMVNEKQADGKIKAKGIQIPFEKRLTDPRLKDVCGFKKFIIDADPNHMKRKVLENAMAKIKEGKDVTKEMKELGIESVSLIAGMLKESKAKVSEYISEYDFIEDLRERIENGDFEGVKVRISGSTEYTYSEKTMKFYGARKINRVEVMPESTPASAEEDITFFITPQTTEDVSLEGEKVILRGFVQQYYHNKKNGFKGDVFVPYDLTLLNNKVASTVVNKFSVDEGVKVIDLKVDLIDGADTVRLGYDDLDEELKEMVDMELMDLKDAIAEMTGGKEVMGNKVKENRIKKVRSKIRDTDYTDENIGNVAAFGVKPMDEDSDPFASSDDDDDLFGDL